MVCYFCYYLAQENQVLKASIKFIYDIFLLSEDLTVDIYLL